MIDTHDDWSSQNPINQIEVEAEEIVEPWANLTEAYYSGHEQAFKDKQAEFLEIANDLLYCLESVENGLTNKMKQLIEKLK